MSTMSSTQLTGNYGTSMQMYNPTYAQQMYNNQMYYQQPTNYYQQPTNYYQQPYWGQQWVAPTPVPTANSGSTAAPTTAPAWPYYQQPSMYNQWGYNQQMLYPSTGISTLNGNYGQNTWGYNQASVYGSVPNNGCYCTPATPVPTASG